MPLLFFSFKKMHCFICSLHAVHPSAGAKNVHMEKRHLIWAAVICCSAPPLTSDGQNLHPRSPPPDFHRQSLCLAATHKIWMWIEDKCAFMSLRAGSSSFFFLFPLHCQKKVFSSNEVPSSISTSELSVPTNQQSSASSADVLAWMAFLWIELADAISDCCSTVVVFTIEAVWSNASALYPQRVCRNKTCAWRIAFWHVNRAVVADQWTQGNSWQGHKWRSKRLLKTSICNCSMSFLHCLWPCLDWKKKMEPF